MKTVTPDEHWADGEYHPLDKNVAAEQMFVLHENCLIEALNRWFGHEQWGLNDVGGQANEKWPLGEDGPKVIQFRGEDILRIDPPSVQRVLAGHHGMIKWRTRYEFLGKARRTVN